jgi:hypothetical protein
MKRSLRSALTCGAVIASLAASACSPGASLPQGQPLASEAASASGAQPLLVAAESAYAFRVAPYVDMTSYPQPNLVTYARETGISTYTLTPVQSNNGACQAAWGGTDVLSQPAGQYYAEQIAALRKAGGDVAVTIFGSTNQNDLAYVCNTPAALAGVLEAIVDRYQVKYLDFDIEGNAPYTALSRARRSAALRLVQDHYAALGRRLAVSYTLPVDPGGLPSAMVGLVQSALRAGVKIAIVNVMTMDYGDSFEPHPQGHMGAYAIEAAQHTVAQLRKIGFPLGTNPYASIGITPMIGQNDVTDEVFEVSDASQLEAWAHANGVGRLAFWAEQRDKSCAGGTNPVASDVCSGIEQKPYQFSKIFAL